MIIKIRRSSLNVNVSSAETGRFVTINNTAEVQKIFFLTENVNHWAVTPIVRSCSVGRLGDGPAGMVAWIP